MIVPGSKEIWPESPSVATDPPGGQNGRMERAQTLETAVRRPEDAPADPAEQGLRFEDPYWDDAFCAWWDPTLRTCC